MRRLLKNATFRNHFRVLGAAGALTSAIVYQQSWKPNYALAETVDIPYPISTNQISLGSSKPVLDNSFLEEFLKAIQQALQNVATAIRYCSRILEYFIYGTPVLLLAPAAIYLQDISPATEEVIWSYLIWTIEQLGPTFIKFAQWASTRPDLYPPQLIEKLLRLQDKVTANYTMSTVERTLETAFGPEWKKAIEIDPNPVGSGCVAQVYKGKLKRVLSNVPATTKSGNFKTRARNFFNGRGNNNNNSNTDDNDDEDSSNSSSNTTKSKSNSSSNSSTKPRTHVEEIPVAIKLIHPHVERLIKTDMELLNIIAYTLDSFPAFELLSFGDTCRQFASMMKDQLDLTKEASNLKKFTKKWAHEKWGQFPQPIDGYINKNVLLETLMEGKSLSDYCNMNNTGDESIKALKLKLSDLGCRAVIKMIFFDNFVHGDLHPGNILVQFTPDGEPHFVFLDCGIVFSAKTEHDHQMLSEVCLAFMKHDGRLAGKLMLDRNLSSRHSTVHSLNQKQRELNTEAFCGGLQQMIDDAENELFFDNFAKYVNRICDLARESRVKLDSNYFQVAMALKIVEGVALSLNRELDMITKCLPIVVKAQTMKQLGILKFPTDDENGNEVVTKTAAVAVTADAKK